MQQPKIIMLTGTGINSEYETKHAFELAGGTVDFVLLKELINNPKMLEDYQIMFVPGGFAHGDALRAGTVFANKLRFNLGDYITDFIKQDKLIGGHCNGAQILIKSGFVPALNNEYGKMQMTLTNNDCGHFINKWIRIKSVSKKCVWTKDLGEMDVPIRHGEGKFYASDQSLYQKLFDNDQVAVVYVGENPNGSPYDIAGICDPTGHVYIMMPHPEVNTDLRNHPLWNKTVRAEINRKVREGIARDKILDTINWKGPGIKVFSNAVDYARQLV